MRLARRPAVYSLPSYSLTGDLLGFLRFGLQYRYTRIGKLPPARPVQMWFGQFIHGVLEESYRRYDVARRTGTDDAPPWEPARLQEIRDVVKRRLSAEGLFPWSAELERLGDARADAAVNDLGPILFPLIRRAEVRLTGARALPFGQIPEAVRFRAADRYEMVGVVDVITNVELADPAAQQNRLVQLIAPLLPADVPERFEVIIDYKGMRRPPIVGSGSGPALWDIYGWQLQTYASLRSVQEDSLPVAAGVVIYVNELLPWTRDFRDLRAEVEAGATDVSPSPGSAEEGILAEWREAGPVPTLPLDFRLARAIRVIPVTAESVQSALTAFDGVVARIEVCRGIELRGGRILQTWERNADEEDTCAACDSRTYCPDYTRQTVPRAPRVRVRRRTGQ